MLDGEPYILEKAIGGESSAFGELYDHYQPKIFRFVLLKVSRREEAEDLTHQIFLHVWVNIRGYKDLGYPFSSWLYRIARNQVIDFYRTHKETLSLEEAPEERLVDMGSASRDLEIKMELGRVTAALHKLRSDYQDVIILRFVEELSIKETASAIKKSEGAVKVMQHRAIAALRELLEESSDLASLTS